MSNQKDVLLGKAPTYRFWILFMNVLAYVTFFTMYQMTSAMGKTIMQDLGIDATRLTGMVTAAMLGFAVLPMFSGPLGNRFGARKTVTCCLLFLGAVSSCFPLAGTNYNLIIILRFLQGAFGGLMVGSVVGSTGQWFPKKESGIATGVLIGILGVGMTIASFIVVPFLNAGMHWQNIMATITPVMAVVVASIYFFTVKNFHTVYPGYKKIDEILPEDISVAEQKMMSKKAQSYVKPDTLGKFVKGETFWLMGIYSFIKTSFTYGLSALFPLLLTVQMGLDRSTVAAVTGATFYITVIAAPLGGFISGKIFKGSRYQIICIGSVLTAITLALIPSVTDVTLLNILLFICYGSTALGTGAYWAMCSEVVEPKVSFEANGLLGSFANAGGTLVPILLAALATAIGSYSITMYILAGMAVIQLFCMWRIRM